MADEPAGSDQKWVVLCSGCAEDAALADEQHVLAPHPEVELACAECGAIIAGYSYRVPEHSWSGMSPGPG